MKILFLIISTTLTLSMPAQKSFYDVYNDIVKLRTTYSENYKRKKLQGDKDSLLLLEQNSQEMAQLFKDMDAKAKKVINLNFPDINFTDVDHKSFMIADFEGELVVNYNYPYCMKCINLIDSTQKRTDGKNIRILVLFTEPYRKDVSFLKPYNENVLIGFITFDTMELISLQRGDDCMYFLDKDHRIEFYEHHDHEAWTGFLDKKFN